MEIWQELEKGKIAWCDHPGVGFRAPPTAAGQVLELKTEQVGCMQIQRGEKKNKSLIVTWPRTGQFIEN